MKRQLRILCMLAGFLCCTGCGRATSSEPFIIIATAANMQFAMDSLTQAFSAKTGIGCHVVIGSSGKLTAQILEGAPFDVFLAADMKYPDTIYKAGKAASQPRIYARGKLVLWTMDPQLSPEPATLSLPAIRHVALPNPKIAPYGVAAMDVMHHFDIFNTVKSKLVYGESIAQANQFITSGAAELGFTSLSSVRSPHVRGRGRWKEIPEASYRPLEQGVVLLQKEGESSEGSRQFYSFLFSRDAMNILSEFGYFSDE